MPPTASGSRPTGGCSAARSSTSGLNDCARNPGHAYRFEPSMDLGWGGTGPTMACANLYGQAALPALGRELTYVATYTSMTKATYTNPMLSSLAWSIARYTVERPHAKQLGEARRSCGRRRGGGRPGGPPSGGSAWASCRGVDPSPWPPSSSRVRMLRAAASSWNGTPFGMCLIETEDGLRQSRSVESADRLALHVPATSPGWLSNELLAGRFPCRGVAERGESTSSPIRHAPPRSTTDEGGLVPSRSASTRTRQRTRPWPSTKRRR